MRRTIKITLGVIFFIYLMNVIIRSLQYDDSFAWMEEINGNVINSEKIFSVSRDCEKESNSFMQNLALLPWNEFNTYSRDHVAQLIEFFTHYLVLEPKVPINQSCSQPPPLIDPSLIDCSAYPKAFNGKRRSKPARIAHIIQFGFDVDVLEIHLREVADVIDFFFILESTSALYKSTRKPLVWERVREQKRFAPFRNKVVHMLLDDIDGMIVNGGKWSLEASQEKRRWAKFVEWNEKIKYFSDDDVIGFGDTDEVPNRNNLQLIKHCEMDGPVDIGIWFTFGELDKAFETDFPVPDHRFTLGDPTFFPLSIAMNAKENGFEDGIPNRLRGKSGRYLLGGMHMTDHRYLPYLLLKDVTCTECGLTLRKINTFLSYAKSGDVRKMELEWTKNAEYRDRIYKIEDVKSELENIAILPWFYNCNRDRYPYWENRHDTRLD